MREALRGAYVSRFTVSPPAISNFFVFFAFCLFVFGWVRLFCLVCFPRFRDQPSSLTPLNDRLSCRATVREVVQAQCSLHCVTGIEGEYYDQHVRSFFEKETDIYFLT